MFTNQESDLNNFVCIVYKLHFHLEYQIEISNVFNFVDLIPEFE